MATLLLERKLNAENWNLPLREAQPVANRSFPALLRLLIQTL